MKKIKLYLIARISKDAHFWNNKICSQLDSSIEIFKPQEHNPWNERHETFSKKVFDTDIVAIKNSHMGLMLPEYGRDCAWEAGYYANSEKPVIVFIDTQIKWLRDWMVRGGLDYVVTNNPKTYEILKKDPILKHHKIILIKQISELNDVIKDIYKKHYLK